MLAVLLALQLSASLTATYNVAAGVPEAWRAPLTLGVRYTQHVDGPLSVQAGAMLRDGNALPGSERLRLDGAGERHWGIGPRLALGRLTLTGSFARTDRRYAPSQSGGYYVVLAAGLEIRAGSFDARVEHAPATLKQWDADVRQTVLRARWGRLALTGARVVGWRDRVGAFVVGTVALRLLGPLAVTGGWEAVPDRAHVLRRQPVLGVGVVLP